MNLKSMKRSGKEIAYYTTLLTDDQGSTDYELTISGPGPLVQKVLSKSEFEIVISPKLAPEKARARADELLAKFRGSASLEQVRPAVTIDSLKSELPAPVPKSSIVASVRRIRGKGTFFFFWFPLIALPRGTDFFWISPDAEFHAEGTVTPMTVPAGGDADLFLTLNSFWTPVVSSSTASGLKPDTVRFNVPPFWVILPHYRVRGFTTCVANFIGWSV